MGSVSVVGNNKGLTVNFRNRSAEEHTSTNISPLSQEIEAVGYLDASIANFSLDFGISREDDNGLSRDFRPGNQKTNRYRSVLTIKPLVSENWDLTGRLLLKGGKFTNFNITEDENETVVDVGITASRNIRSMILILHSSGKYVGLGDINGSTFSTGVLGEWLFMDNLSFRAGAEFYAFAMPDEETENKIFPNVHMDWAMTPHSFVKLNFKPGIITHSFSDIYLKNGLVTSKTPVLFEKRTVDLDGELGLRSGSEFSVSAGAFYIETERPPVFRRSGDFFDVVKGAKIDFSGFRLKSAYQRNNVWGLNGIITKTSWNFSGNVPYIPSIEAHFNGFYIPYRFWKIRALLLFTGKHYIDVDSDETKGSFFILDLGVDRELWKQYLSMYLDIRNITNSKGTWWTERYQIPGVGLYVGIKAHY